MTARSLTIPANRKTALLWVGIPLVLLATFAIAQQVSRDSYFTLTENGSYDYTAPWDPAVTYDPGEVAIHVVAFGEWKADVGGSVLGDVTFTGTYSDGQILFGQDVCGFYPTVPYPNISIAYAIPASACQ